MAQGGCTKLRYNLSVFAHLGLHNVLHDETFVHGVVAVERDPCGMKVVQLVGTKIFNLKDVIIE